VVKLKYTAVNVDVCVPEGTLKCVVNPMPVYKIENKTRTMLWYMNMIMVNVGSSILVS
jgi:hypothetical protein